MKDNGTKINRMGTVCINNLMVLYTRENGYLINTTAKEKNLGLMEQSLKDNTWRAKSTEKEKTFKSL